MDPKRNVGMLGKVAVQVVDALVEFDQKLREFGTDLRVCPEQIDTALQRLLLSKHLVPDAGDEHANQSTFRSVIAATSGASKIPGGRGRSRCVHRRRHGASARALRNGASCGPAGATGTPAAWHRSDQPRLPSYTSGRSSPDSSR